MKTEIIKKIYKHKVLTVLILAAVIFGGNSIYQKLNGEEDVSKYVLASVEKGTIIVSVSGSGQISSLEETDIQSEVKSDILGFYVEQGEEVKKGQLIAKLDKSDFEDAVEDAEIAYESVKEDLDELINPDEDMIAQAEEDLADAITAEEDAAEEIDDGYDDVFSTLSNVFMDLSEVITEADEILYGYQIAKSERSVDDTQTNEVVYQNIFAAEDRTVIIPFVTAAEDNYEIAREKYDLGLENYRALTVSSEKEELESLLNESLEMTKALVQTIKDEINLVDFVVDYVSTKDRTLYSQITTYQSELRTYLTKANSFSTSISSAVKTLEDNEDALVDAEETVKDAQEALDDLKAGPDDLELRSQQSIVRQKEDALNSAEQDLENCNIYAPFAGTISGTNIEAGESVSSGTVLATLITQQKIAEITLNEVDAASVKVGQKATLTFDALTDVSVTGEVIEVDEVGTASSGVVNYGVKIILDSDLDTVKSGMSVTADIITNIKQDVLVIDSSAIKTQDDTSYVEVVSEENQAALLTANGSGVILSEPTTKQTVEVGISNDSLTEIVSGLEEGDVVVSSTLSQTSSTKTTSSNSSISIPGVTDGGQMMR